MEISFKIVLDKKEQRERIPVIVFFSDDDKKQYLRTGETEIWLNGQDIKAASLEQIQAVALSEAILFLKEVLVSLES
jgi:hypothetical protein